ncbi:hypothetical protein [Beijerinckia indica]|uniref:Lipoprotein n=1 Tax=Beijerinckia indica subsp. indica (strain ATCC 9039 / DSM 1715 / NCIMB 8712) TaxID=395963 RepID=B2IFB6_BEII9|nr:hypothetical protein [Beijerinckia indica]ACB95681.1 hypothetical protein Bind_2060 [Beijerinckia indica subsp. indica ATCC 9039]
MPPSLRRIFLFSACAVALPLALGSCADFPGRCQLGIAREDCWRGDASLGHFPNDDAVCRSYGLAPGSESYAVCRREKARVDKDTRTSIDKQWWGGGPL